VARTRSDATSHACANHVRETVAFGAIIVPPLIADTPSVYQSALRHQTILRRAPAPTPLGRGCCAADATLVPVA
jgi:hypothetical protein